MCERLACVSEISPLGRVCFVFADFRPLWGEGLGASLHYKDTEARRGTGLLHPCRPAFSNRVSPTVS